MVRKKSVAIFDFCETLVDLQSADEFVLFVHQNNQLPILNQWLFASWKWARKFRFLAVYDRIFRNNPIEKKWLLYSLKGLTEEFIMQQATQFSEWLKTRINENVWNQFEFTTKNSDLVIICSGGYEVYLRSFFSEFDVQIIATRIQFKNGKFTGRMDGLDCLRHEKVKRIEKSYGSEIWSQAEIEFYSDSITDMPLFEKSNRKIVAYKSNLPIWASADKFETIKWKN